MKIKFSDVIPGMVIRTEIGDVLFITFISKPGSFDMLFGESPFIAYFPLDHAEMGQCSREYDKDMLVKVITGDKRTKYVKEVFRQTRERIHAAQKDLHTLETITKLFDRVE